MTQKYLIEFFLQHIPESIALTFTIAVFLKIKLEPLKIICIGVIVASVVFLIRSTLFRKQI